MAARYRHFRAEHARPRYRHGRSAVQYVPLRREVDGTDISPEQIEQAKKLSEGMDIGYYAMPAEKIDFPDASFDAATACQCFWYFDHEKLIPRLCRMLKSDGRFLVLCME